MKVYYDDGIVRGCIRISGTEIVRLFVEPSFQGNGIGARLQDARQKRRLSLGEVCRRAGISPERMRLLESDGRRMMMTELSALCKTLGLSVNELLFGPCAEEMRQ